MPIYRFIIHGRMADDSGGFYTTRWCRAPDEGAAAQRAMKIVCNEWEGPPIHALQIDEGRRISFWEIWNAPNRGCTFYSD